jgi:hypothetical protein
MAASTPSTATESLAALALKPDPVMVTWVPTLPLSGVKELTVTVLPVLVLLQLNAIDNRMPEKRSQPANCLYWTRIIGDLMIPN